MSSQVCTSPRTTGEIRMPVCTSSIATDRPITTPADPWRMVPFSNFAMPIALFVMSTSSAFTARTALRSRLSLVAAYSSSRSSV